VTGPWRTLLVEDDPVVAEVQRRLVDRTPGFATVAVAPTALDARRLLVLKRPQLVLLDLGLPDGDGLELLRAIRRADSPVEVVAITAARDRATVRDCMHLGVVDYLVKPFAPERLQEALLRFRERMLTLRMTVLDQDEVDAVAGTRAVPDLLPRDLSGETLNAVRVLLRGLNPNESVAAGGVAETLGLHRVTARRYLEYLVTTGEADAEPLVLGPGRPRKAYGLRRPDGAAGGGQVAGRADA
jgi:response regulator of citrate/malate metabolism